jgi:hypothetical protein
VDLSSWTSNPPVSYSGFGVGVAETPLPHLLSSSSKASYRIYVTAKVGGTSAGVTNVSGSIDLNFFAPVGQVYDLTSSLALSTNWQTYKIDGGTNMQVAAWLAGAQRLFDENVTNVNKMELQITVPGSPNVGSLFGYDKDNTVEIDNLKVVQLVSGLAPLSLVHTNGQAQVLWADPMIGRRSRLQCAADVAVP